MYLHSLEKAAHADDKEKRKQPERQKSLWLW